MAKFSAQDRARRVLLDLTDSPNLKFVWIESCRKIRKQDKYDLVLRTNEELHYGDLETIITILGGVAGPLSSGYEEGYSCCGGGSSYLEFDLSGCTIPN